MTPAATAAALDVTASTSPLSPGAREREPVRPASP